MSFSFSCTGRPRRVSATSASARIRRQHVVADGLHRHALADGEREEPDVRRAEPVAAAIGRVPSRSSCGSRSPSTSTLPIGERDRGDPHPCRSSVCLAAGSSWPSVEVDDVDPPRAADLDVGRRRAPAARRAWTSGSGVDLVAESGQSPAGRSLHSSRGQAADQVALEDEVQHDDRHRTDQGRGHHLRRRPGSPRPPAWRRTPAGRRRPYGCPGWSSPRRTARRSSRAGRRRSPETTIAGPAERDDDPGQDLRQDEAPSMRAASSSSLGSPRR